MPVLLAIFVLVLLASFAATPTMGADWVWDFNNGLGFAALAGMLYLVIPVDARRDIRRHEMVGYAVLAIATVHSFWFLLADGAMVEYIKPGAPAYMWLGIAGLLALYLTTVLAMLPTRLRIHRNNASFKFWHRLLALVAVAATAYHIIASGFYLTTWYQLLGLLLLIVVLTLSSPLRRALRRRGTSAVAYLAVCAAGALAFAAIRNVSP